MNACPDFLDTPEYSQADYDSMISGFDDSLYYSEPVIIDTPPAKPHAHTPTKTTTPQNQAVYRLDAFDICTRASAEISLISDNFGIDGQALINVLNRSESEYKNDTKTGINSDKSYKGKSKVWLDIKTARSGQEYPVLTFHSFKEGGITEVFNGYKFLLDSGLVNAKPLSDAEKNTLETKRAERGQQQAKRAELATQKQAYENSRKTTRFNQFTTVFNSLPKLSAESFNDTYLAKKGFTFEQLPAEFIIKRGFDNRGGFIVYALKNATQQTTGYQKIYDSLFIDNSGNERNKDFIFLPSAKNGSYATLSHSKKINKALKIYLCEGLATALTVFIATGQPVAIALDAGNLVHVATALNVHFKNITIAADNDITPNSDKNTGIDKAKETAKAINCSIVYPDMNGIKCDFNDLMINQGIEAVKKILNSYHNYSYVNTRYLNVLFKDGVNIIKSTYDTGKTYTVARYIKKHPELSVLYIAHLITLCSQAAARLGIDNYNDCKQLNDKEQLSICINSLFKLLKNGIVNNYEVIVLDEIEQLFSRLTSTGKDAIKHKPIIIGVLKSLIANAKMVICLDADISEITLNFIKGCRPDEQFNIVINEFNHAKKMYVYENRTDIIKLGKTHTANHEPVLFATNSITESEYIFKQIDCDNKRLINSRTSGLAENRDFLNDVNVKCKSDNLTVISPSLSTGFSIESGHYQHNLAIFSHQVNTPLDCLQQLERDRLTQEKHVYISDVVTDYKPKQTKHGHDFNMMNIDNYGALVCSDPAYSQLVNDVEKRNIKLMGRFKEEFISLAKEKGYEVIIVNETATMPEIVQDKAEKTAIKVEKELERAERLATVEPFNNAMEYEGAKNSTNLPAEEKLRIERYEIEQFYAVELEKSATLAKQAEPTKDIEVIKREVLTQVILNDDNGARREKAKNLKLAIAEIQDVKQQQARKAEKRFIEDIEYIMPKHLLLSQLFKAVGINKDLTLSKDFYTADDLSEFIEWANDERELIASFWSTMPSKETILDNPYRYVRTLLETVGLTQVRKQKKGNDKKTVLLGYSVDKDVLANWSHFFRISNDSSISVTEYDKAA
jgi:phage/plasmid primase-like uncharacterized protein